MFCSSCSHCATSSAMIAVFSVCSASSFACDLSPARRFELCSMPSSAAPTSTIDIVASRVGALHGHGS